MKITIDLSEDEVKILEDRAEKNLLDFKEQIEDIIRRSCIMGLNKIKKFKCDDALVEVFSRDGRGRKKRKKIAKAIKKQVKKTTKKVKKKVKKAKKQVKKVIKKKLK